MREIKPGNELIVALDRTQWRDHIVLMASAIYHKRAFPIFWELLDKDGASSLAEQQKVLRPVIRLLIPIVKGNNSILVPPLTRGAAWGRRLLHNFGEMVS